MTPTLALAQMGPENAVFALVFGFVLLFVLVFLFTYGALYVRAAVANARVGLFEILGMKLRGVPPALIVNCYIMAVKAGVPVTVEGLEVHCLARGNVRNVVWALIAAGEADIPLTFNQACAIDLADRDVLGAVRDCLYPVVIDCPDPTKGAEYVSATARDGVQVRAKARVTARRNLERLVGGGNEEGFVSRILEWLPNAIGCEDSAELLEHPDVIADRLLEKDIGAKTCFDILSIEVVTKR